MVHYTDSYLLNPQHVITVCVIGAGGTGSQMLSNLARINQALLAFDHPGLHVYCFDDDKVSDANVGRQLFSPSDVGYYKSTVLISRLNRFFGTSWEAIADKYNGTPANIIISCVDTAAARIEIDKMISLKGSEPHEKCLYWLDLGNLQKTGQVILGTLKNIKQPKSEEETTDKLKTVTQEFKLSKIKEVNQGPSCSLAAALAKQDLFINSTLAQFGANLIWKLFREGMIRVRGCYVNLETLSVNAIKI